MIALIPRPDSLAIYTPPILMVVPVIHELQRLHDPLVLRHYRITAHRYPMSSTLAGEALLTRREDERYKSISALLPEAHPRPADQFDICYIVGVKDSPPSSEVVDATNLGTGCLAPVIPWPM